MVVQVKLYGLLRIKHKDYDRDKGIRITMEKEASIMDLLNRMNMNMQEVSVIFVNHRPIKEFGYLLREGDVIKIFSHFPAGG